MSSQEEIQIQEARFNEWVKEYEVYEHLPEDELEVSAENKPFIWSEFQNDDETYIAPGYTEADPDLRMPVVGYFLSRIPHPETQDDFVISSVLLDCPECEAMGENEDGDECDTCSGDRGTYIDFSIDAE